MELHQLRYFCAVAETGSFSRAAQHSHVSQPSLSQQILKLEGELGVRLFDRLGRSVRLTEVGKAFLPRALSVLRELEAARGDVVESKESVSGQVAVGVIPTVAPYFLPPVLAAFAKLFPKSTVTVVEEITPVLLERLRAGSIDIALLALPVRGHEFEALPLITEPLFAALPRNHRLSRNKTVALGELRKEPFLLLRDGHCFRENAIGACARARYPRWPSIAARKSASCAFPIPRPHEPSARSPFADAHSPARTRPSSPVFPSQADLLARRSCC